MDLGLAAPCDVQASRPTRHFPLSRVGLTGIEKVIRIPAGDAGAPQLFSARLECFIDLGPRQNAAHMSRFEEVVNEVIGEVVGETHLRAEQLATHVAKGVRERHDALRAEATIAARYPEHKPAPVSGVLTQEIFTLHGTAIATAAGTRRITGVTAQGITACPNGQQLVGGHASERLRAAGFSQEDIARILQAVPVATHDQRGFGTLHIGAREEDDTEIDALTLLEIVEGSMSSEIYELMKRSDEGAVVARAHRRPRFVEDCVREMLRGAVERFEDLDGGHFISARQEALGTIHQHSAIAEGYGLLSEIRDEIASDGLVPYHSSRRAWLDAVDG